VSARAWAGFLIVSVLWGMPYLFIKVAVDDDIPPAFLAWMRVCLAAAIVIALAWRAGLLASTLDRLVWLAAYAVIEICIPFPLIAFGEQRVSSSLTAILIAAVPTFVALLSLRFIPSERLDRRRGVGLLFWFEGVVALVGVDIAGESREVVGAVAVLLSAFMYAAGPMILMAKFADLDPRATMAVALAVAAVVLTPFAWLDPPDHGFTTEALASVVVLAVFCTAAAFVVFGALIAEVGAGRAAVITYVAPVVAVALGVAVLDEHVSWGAGAGLVLILAGSWLSTNGPRTSRTVAHVEPA
jgi:drug/metabolite transporter (DMT)-like permease